MTLYEMNQAGYASLPRMAKSAVETKRVQVSDWLQETILPQYYNEQNIYMMLLNNDINYHYYTIFAWQEGSSNALATEIFSIVKELGTIKAIEKNDNGAWEFWITNQKGATNAYYLFDYTQGVIEV